MLYKSSLRILEGKQQAIAILQKNMPKDVDDIFIKGIVNELETFDPTSPKNKYIEALAKVFSSIFNGYAKTGKMNSEHSYLNAIKNLKHNFEHYKFEDKIKSIEKRNLSIDLTKIKNLEDFTKQIDSVYSTLTKSIKKKGITGLKEGVDYLYFGNLVSELGRTYQGYIPLNWEASKVIASNRVGACEGKWCTAYQKDNQYWRQYVKKDKDLFIYAIAEEQSGNREDKLALQFGGGGRLSMMWWSDDASIRPSSFFTREQLDDINDRMDKLKDKAISIIFSSTDNTQLFEYMKQELKKTLEVYRVNKGETSTVENDTWILKTNGWTNDTTVHDFLNSDLVALLDTDDIGENFRNDYWEKRSETEIVDYIQDYVKDPKAKEEVEKYYPRIFDISINDDDFDEWVESLDRELDDLNRMINRASEQAYMDDGVEALLSLAKSRLEEAFMVTVKNWDEIILELPLQSLYDYLDTSDKEDEDEVDEMLNDFEIGEYLREEYEDMFKYNDRYDLYNVFGDASYKVGEEKYNYLEMAINEYGIEGY